MNKSVKKILYIGLPIVLIMIAISIIFYVKSSQCNNISKGTTQSELISYSIAENSFSSEETVESTESNRIYQTKVILNLHNMAKYDLGNFDINIKFIEDGNDEDWIYTQEDFTFFGDNKLIVTSTREYKATAIDNVYVQFESDKNTKVYIYSLSEYNELYGENNVIISPTSLKIYKTLTIACILFTIVIAVAIALLILVYTRPDEEDLVKVKKSTKSLDEHKDKPATEKTLTTKSKLSTSNNPKSTSKKQTTNNKPKK